MKWQSKAYFVEKVRKKNISKCHLLIFFFTNILSVKESSQEGRYVIRGPYLSSDVISC